MSGSVPCWGVVDAIPSVKAGNPPHRVIEAAVESQRVLRLERMVVALDCHTGENWRTKSTTWHAERDLESASRASAGRSSWEMLSDLARAAGLEVLESRRCSGLDVAGSLIASRPDLRFALWSLRTGAKSLLEKGRVSLASYESTGEIVWLTADQHEAASGLKVGQWLDYLALVGGKGLLGVTGCGDKTARDLLAKCGTWEGILAAVDSLPDKLATAVRLAEPRFAMERLAWGAKLDCLVADHAWRCQIAGDGEDRRLECRCVVHEQKPLFYSLLPGTEADRTVRWVSDIIRRDGYFDPLRHN